MVTAEAEAIRDDAVCYFRQAKPSARLAWVTELSELNLRLFAVELSDALKSLTLTGNADDLAELLEDWKTTALLDASPELRAEIARPKERRPLESFMSESAAPR